MLIPENIEIQSEICFADCHSLSLVPFAMDCCLKSHENNTFCRSELASIIVPKSISFVDDSLFRQFHSAAET
jgi:hypothetical protein